MGVLFSMSPGLNTTMVRGKGLSEPKRGKEEAPALGLPSGTRCPPNVRGDPKLTSITSVGEKHERGIWGRTEKRPLRRAPKRS